MNPRSPLDMMSPFDIAWDLLKYQSYFLMKSDNLIYNLLKMGREGDAMELQTMRQFVLDNMNSPDPQMKEMADQMYQYLTELMSYTGGSKQGSAPIMPQPLQQIMMPVSSRVDEVDPKSGMGASDFPVGVKPPQEQPPEEENDEEF